MNLWQFLPINQKGVHERTFIGKKYFNIVSKLSTQRRFLSSVLIAPFMSGLYPLSKLIHLKHKCILLPLMGVFYTLFGSNTCSLTM